MRELGMSEGKARRQEPKRVKKLKLLKKKKKNLTCLQFSKLESAKARRKSKFP